MNELIIGLGEIGKAVKQVICPQASTYDINRRNYRTASQIDIMHICFPYSDNFLKATTDYQAHYRPDRIVIWSTVPIGTTKQIKQAIHTPVEGKHPELAKSLELMTRWVGYNDESLGQYFKQYFENRGLTTHLEVNSDYTEALKLLSTTEYGINLIFADYKARVAKEIGMPFTLTKEWNKDYNKLYQGLMLTNFQKFVLDAPKGLIGGHYIRENAAILQEDYDDDLLDLILEMKGTNGW